MNYQHILLCYFKQQPFASLANLDNRQQLFQIGMMEASVENYITELKLCIEPLVLAKEEHLQSQLGFELGIAQIILGKIQNEHHELINLPV